MAATPSTMAPLGMMAPTFTLPDAVTGRLWTLDDTGHAAATVIMFICNHCPYVIHVREQLVALANDYIPRGIAFLAISSNDAATYRDDAPEKMKEIAEQHEFPFPYLFDETQEVARAYDAACTPDIFVFGSDRRLIYRGQLDASRPGNNIPVTGADVRAALDAALAGLPVNPDQHPSIGCNIKWKR